MQETTMMEKEQDRMSLEGFEKCIVLDLQKALGGNVLVHEMPVIKNNDTKLHGLNILKKTGETNISPTIYLDCYYSEYLKGRGMKEIVEEIIKVCQDNLPDGNFDVSCFTDWEKVKTGIIVKVVNYDRNRELLQDIPYFKFLDLAIVFSCLLSNTGDGAATILIHNHHLELWNKTKEDLHDLALVNTQRLLPYELRNMGDIMNELMNEMFVESEEQNMPEADVPMYVLSNKTKLNGATCILYPDILKNFSEKLGVDILMVLPSSVHEVLLIPVVGADISAQYNELSAMVREVNEIQLTNEEILSDHAYIFYAQEGVLEMEEKGGYSVGA